MSVSPGAASADASGRVLVLLAHPALQRSRVNRRMIEAVSALPGVTVHDLYEAYPDHDIDVPREQALLVHHEIIVWQHPMLWYAVPSLLKLWQELVLDLGWAYGPGGTALRGKRLLCALTTGGGEQAYGPGGDRPPIATLYAAAEATARLCGMPWEQPFVVHGALRLDAATAEGHALRYRERISGLLSTQEAS